MSINSEELHIDDGRAGYLPILNPTKAIENANRNGSPDTFFGKANSIELVRGAQPGKAWMLLSKAAIVSLQQDDWFDFHWKADGDTTYFGGWVFVDSIAIDFALSQADGGATHLCYFEDIRRLLWASSTEQQFNVRIPCPPTDDSVSDTNLYYTATLNAGALHTWQTVLDALWSDVWDEIDAAPPSPTLVVAPTSTPENLRFIGVSAWEAYCKVLELAGHTCWWDGHADSGVQNIKLILLSHEADNLTSEQIAAQGDKIYDSAGYLSAELLGAYPKIVRVFFPKRMAYAGSERDTPDANNFELEPYHTVDVDLSSDYTNSSGVVPVWADMDAVFVDLDPTPANATAVNVRANEIAERVAPRDAVSHSGFSLVYHGLHTEFHPTSTFDSVTFRNYGDGLGLVTECGTRPQKPFDFDPFRRFMRPIDMERMVRPSYPQYAQLLKVTGAWNSSVKAYSGKVMLLIDSAWTELEDCWVMPASQTDIGLYHADLPTQYHGPGRLVGLEGVSAECKPCYVIEDCFSVKPNIDFKLTVELTIADLTGTATIEEQWGPGPDMVTSPIQLLNHEIHTTGVYMFRGQIGDTGKAIHYKGKQYKIFQLECP